MKILTHLNLSQNELQNAVLHKLAVAPENPKVGQIYFNTVDKKAYIYQETGWENLGLSNELLAKLDAIEACKEDLQGGYIGRIVEVAIEIKSRVERILFFAILFTSIFCLTIFV